MNSLKALYIVLLTVVLTNFKANSQTYGNEWINYSQRYFSFNVYSTGIHKLDYNTLNAASIPLTTFMTENIQIFGRENEIPIYIVDGGDHSFDAGDYILFYAEKNDGWLDTTLYDSANDVGNPKYSLYNDTIQYFFTWNSSVTNLRYTVETDINYSSYSPSNYIISELFASYNSSYNEGEKSSEASSSFFTSGEGWGNTIVNGNSGYTWDYSSVQFSQIYQGTDAPDVIYKAVGVGVSNASTSTYNHHTKTIIGNSGYVISDTSFTGYKAIHYTNSFPVSVLPASGNSNFKISIVGDLGVATDYQSINYWSFTYPQTTNLAGATNAVFKVDNNATQSKIRLDLTNLSVNDPLVFVLGDTPRKVSLNANGSAYSLLFPNSSSSSQQQVIYQEASTVISVDDLTAVNSSGYFTDYSTLNAEKALLMIYHPLLQSASSDYAVYRKSAAGGSYNAILANVNELYQQFGGGIEKHINGIRRFGHFMYDQATEKPVGLFLMGKGIREANIVSTTASGPGSRTSTANFASSLIPSFGQPSSDNCITSNLSGTNKWTPLIPTGRVAASTNQELADYLNKIISYENNQVQSAVYNSDTKDWQKQVLHFVGGSNASQQSLFQYYMAQMANTISDSYFGGNVTTIAKTNSDPLSPTVLNSIMERIQEGVSLITYFGHASATSSGFEINLDDPANWNNYGKTPLMISNSCYNGNMFQSTTSKSEEFVLVADYGAIGYLGTINLGFDGYLALYSQQLYKQMSKYQYGSTLASQMKLTIDSLYNSSMGTTYLPYESTMTQMALNGDPMLKLNWHEKPEMEITEQSLSFSPENIDLTVDSITLSLQIKNLGRSVNDTAFVVEITRNFPGTSVDSVYTLFVDSINYLYDLELKVPLQPNIGVGINTFSVKVDIPSFIDEQYDELDNNQLTKTLYINIDGIQPVLPYEYAVVPEDSVTLIASTINPIADYNTYRFEIDTIDFEGNPSPFHRYALVSGLGGVKEVNPQNWKLTTTGATAPLVCTDSTVYFWRVAVAEASPTWRESSFQYITGKTGWGQDHFFQFKNNSFNNVIYDRTNRLREFGTNQKTLKCVAKSATSIPDIYYNLYSIDDQEQEYGLCLTTPSFYVAVIDPLSLEPWGTRYGSENPTHGFGNANDNGSCRSRVEYYFIFRENDASQLTSFQNMINAIPNDYYILVYSPVSTLWSSMPSSIISTFQSLGSDSITAGRPDLPFAFFCKKGDPTTVVEEFAQQSGEDVNLEGILEGNDYTGYEYSPMIGPAAEWKSLFWKQDPLETASSDSTELYIKAYDITGALQFTIDTVFTHNDSIINLGGIVNASSYPYIQLGTFYEDTATFTPAQIDRWHVLFTPLPEAAIDGSNGYVWLPATDTLSEGEEVRFAADIKNIYTIPMDSLLVKYWIQDQDQNIHSISYARQDSLRVGETFRDTVSFSTTGLSGLNSFWMEVNPYVNGSYYVTDQPEQQHFNNLLQIPFYINGDNENPILDVTFDGRHILNGDIVSSESEILITLKDENPYLIMDDVSDTTLFGVYLTDPNGTQKRIPFMDGLGNTVMQWIPADSSYKRFKIIFPASFTMNGKYTLLVQGSDESGNLSGDTEYKITFQVIRESMITYFVNYPNPFSTSTRFVFTITGNEVPDEIIIQIMTVSGKVVREITEDELGPLQIGRNVSAYAWDGKDQFGDQLANGVYLYRVKAQLNGEEINHYETGADQYFKKEFGKMYLMR